MNNPFKTLLARKDLPAGYPVGSWVMSASPVVAEAMGCAGYDWAVLDMEHTPLDMMEIIYLLQAVAGTPMVPITRVPWNDAVMVKRVLDAGVQTVMFPFVQSAEEARRAVSAAKYAPEGSRGMAGMSRASRFGTVKDYFKVANAGVSVIVQVETPESMACIEEIASVPGVDSIFMGPGDLSGAMGHVGDLLHPEVVALMADGVKRCHQVGKPVGTVGGTPEAVALYRAAGFDYIGCGSDLGLLMRQNAAVLSAIRAQDIQIQSQGY
ncbi:HpcH/HpaI aldolase/citrate lyase family protein [Rhodoferax sp. PAMC 29310]|uniref:HpcH/HpaI aldolase family protein n=1 Tax=Rhodoferax sp. PAMC 29310 TaxID=2822760 RepID=UPI001B33C261|nr:aldolase/citrate lyase family protein [Rhodoferax sp. PAMC 29310]